jgi:hypothetical protein
VRCRKSWLLDPQILSPPPPGASSFLKSRKWIFDLSDMNFEPSIWEQAWLIFVNSMVQTSNNPSSHARQLTGTHAPLLPSPPAGSATVHFLGNSFCMWKYHWPVTKISWLKKTIDGNLISLFGDDRWWWPNGYPTFGGGLGRVGGWVGQGRLPEINCEFFHYVPSGRGGFAL